MGAFILKDDNKYYLSEGGELIDVTEAVIAGIVGALLDDELEEDLEEIERLDAEIADEDIPFCDCADCPDCPETDQLDDYEVVDEDDFPYDGEEGEEIPLWGIPDINRVIFCDPATIVFWEDGTKTIVKTCDGDKFERYMGFAVACMKKMFGSTSRAKKILDEVAVDQVVDRKHKQSNYVPDLNTAFSKVVGQLEDTDGTPEE